MGAVDLKLLLLYFIFSTFQETVETAYSPWDANSPVCFARLMGRLFYSKNVFLPLKKKKKVFHCVMTLWVTKATVVAFHKVLVLLQVR